jgi:hypothetical protein
LASLMPIDDLPAPAIPINDIEFFIFFARVS